MYAIRNYKSAVTCTFATVDQSAVTSHDNQEKINAIIMRSRFSEEIGCIYSQGKNFTRDLQSSNQKGSVMLISTQQPSPITHHNFSIASLTNKQQDKCKVICL